MTHSATQPWKLRYAPHIGLTAPDAPLFLDSAGSSDPVDQIRYLASLGFAGIEDNGLKLRPPAMQEKIGAELARRGLQMGCFVNNPLTWNQPIWGSTDPAARERLDRDLQESITTARRTGGRHLTVVTGRDPDSPAAIQRANMTENLKRAAETALKADVMLAVETVDARGWPGMLLNHIADAHAMVEAVDSPSVGLVFDIGHIQSMDGAVIDNLNAAWDRIAVIQVADIPGRLELGTGELNWINIFRAIQARGYAGLIELEHVISRPGADGEQAALRALSAIDAAL